MKHSSLAPFALLLLTALAFSAGRFSAQTAPSAPLQAVEPTAPPASQAPLPRIQDLQDVWTILKTSYYDAGRLVPEKLAWGAIKGFVEAIDDPYTVFMTPEESKEFENGLEGQLQGIGAQLEIKNKELTVVAPLKNSPAEAAGLRAGDVIFKINGILAETMSLPEAVSKIRGAKGTRVTLTIFREGVAKPFDLTITRGEITLNTIELKKLDGNIYHLALIQFNDHTKKEFEDAIEKIILEKPRGLIFDLRDNGGGYLDIAVDMLSELLPAGKTAVIIKERDASKNEVKQTGGLSRLADTPLVVLINEGSASASEIVAGAVQDFKRGLVIGEKSFGKGSVQEITKFDDGAQMRFTIAKWFTPLDRSIDGKGITPDKEVKTTEEDYQQKRDPPLDAAVEYFRLRASQ